MSLRKCFAWFQQLESHEALQLKQNKTAMWKNIMPHSLSNTCFVRKYGAWWFNAENENGVVFFKFTHRYCMCHKQQCGHSANKRKGSHSRHEPLPSPSPCRSVHAALHSAVSCQALKIVAVTTEVRINSSIQAHTNNQKITCNPRYTAGMPITLSNNRFLWGRGQSRAP